MENNKPMLERDYGQIIITGLCNSPDHLLHHYYKREIENLKERRYSEEEIEYNLRHVLGMMKDSIRKSYERSLKSFEEYKKADETLPKEKRYHYPKPDITQTPIFQFVFPRSKHLLIFPDGRNFLLKDFQTVEDALSKVFSSPDTGIQAEKDEPKTLLIARAVEPVFDIMKDYFDCNHHEELMRILQTGGTAKSTLLFRSNANRLSETLKMLHKHEMIIGWQKKELIQWIITNFKFLHYGKAKPFKKDSVERVVSGKIYPCKNPIIKVENGEVIKADPAPRKLRQKW